MKVGLFTTNQQYLETDMVEALDEQIAMVHAARDGGWDSLFSVQHYLNEGNNKQLQLVPFLSRLIPEAGDMTTGRRIALVQVFGIRSRTEHSGGDRAHIATGLVGLLQVQQQIQQQVQHQVQWHIEQRKLWLCWLSLKRALLHLQRTI